MPIVLVDRRIEGRRFRPRGPGQRAGGPAGHGAPDRAGFRCHRLCRAALDGRRFAPDARRRFPGRDGRASGLRGRIAGIFAT